MNFGDPVISARVWDKCVPVPEVGCWIWIRPYTGSPQVTLKDPKRNVSVKRLLYETVNGPTPAYFIVGGCIGACVNPHHQIAGSQSDVVKALRAKTCPKEIRKKLHLESRSRYRDKNREKTMKWHRDQARRYRIKHRETILPKRRAQGRLLREERQRWLHAIKSVPCLDCGRTFDPVCMDFDHRPGEVKLFPIGRESANLRRSLEEVRHEITKCDVICACCHRLRTYRKRDHGALVREAQRRHKERKDTPPQVVPPVLEDLVIVALDDHGHDSVKSAS